MDLNTSKIPHFLTEQSQLRLESIMPS